jgi:DNA repair exonuclease SbcCD nuclease subunit
MKFVTVSDLHLDWVTDGVPRFDDIAGQVEDVATYCLSDPAEDVFVCLGDITNPNSPATLRSISWVASFATRLALNGFRSIWVAGNHDTADDGYGTTTLSPLRDINPLVTVCEVPRVIRIARTGSDDLVVFGLPYPGVGATHRAREMMNDLSGESIPHIILSHLTLPGMHPGSETTAMPRGPDVQLPLDECRRLQENHRTVVVNGHYHAGGVHNIEGLEVWIPGAVAKLTHGEEKNSPGFLEIVV